MCNKQVSVSSSSVAEKLGKAKDIPRETGATWEAEMFTMPASCASVLLGEAGSSLAGVMGNESVPDDWEVERDARVEANGVVAREDTTLVCL